MPAHSGLGLPNRAYQEVYNENGRWYGTFRRGNYMFPIDEVGTSALSCFVPARFRSPS